MVGTCFWSLLYNFIVIVVVAPGCSTMGKCHCVSNTASHMRWEKGWCFRLLCTMLERCFFLGIYDKISRKIDGLFYLIHSYQCTIPSSQNCDKHGHMGNGYIASPRAKCYMCWPYIWIRIHFQLGCDNTNLGHALKWSFSCCQNTLWIVSDSFSGEVRETYAFSEHKLEIFCRTFVKQTVG